MSRAKANQLLRLVESFFREHLERMRGVSPHTIRAYRDALRLLFTFIADKNRREVAKLQLTDLQRRSRQGVPRALGIPAGQQTRDP